LWCNFWDPSVARWLFCWSFGVWIWISVEPNVIPEYSGWHRPIQSRTLCWHTFAGVQRHYPYGAHVPVLLDVGAAGFD
jgi:hypothetical protein